jgi:hypothetical protein
MGYPMTFRRVMNRNGLQDGDYTTPPERHARRVITNATEATLQSEQETLIGRAPHWAKRVEEYEQVFKMLAGDLRRLERDAVDEYSICQRIAARTGINADVVAAVLKEFIGT